MPVDCSERYNQKIALDEFKKAAKQGNAFCQYQVGLMYEGSRGNEIGTWIDYDKAFKYYNKAANQGLAIAQIKLGSMYFYGDKLSQKFEKAFEYFEKAASQENQHAQLMLGHMFEHGKGTIQNFEKAFEYYEKAASQNQIGALMHLGRMYENGIGTDIDLEKAFEYYKKVDVFNHPDVQEKLEEMYENGIGTDKNLQKSKEYDKKSCLLNDADLYIFGNQPDLYKYYESLKEADFIFEIGDERKKLLKRYLEEELPRMDEDDIKLFTKHFLKQNHFDESSENVQSITVKRKLDDTTESSISPAKKSR
jgi:TPR repeat protein